MCAYPAYPNENVRLGGDFTACQDASQLHASFVREGSGETHFAKVASVCENEVEITVPVVSQGTFNVVITHNDAVICQHEVCVPCDAVLETMKFVSEHLKDARDSKLQMFLENIKKKIDEKPGVLMSIENVHRADNPKWSVEFSYSEDPSDCHPATPYRNYLDAFVAESRTLSKGGAEIRMLARPIDRFGGDTLDGRLVPLPLAERTLNGIFRSAHFRLPGCFLVDVEEYSTYLVNPSDGELELKLESLVSELRPGDAAAALGVFPRGITAGHRVCVFDNGFCKVTAHQVIPASGQPTSIIFRIPPQMPPGDHRLCISFGGQETNSLNLTVAEVSNLPDEEEELPAAAPVAQPYDEDETEELESPSKRRKMPY